MTSPARPSPWRSRSCRPGHECPPASRRCLEDSGVTTARTLRLPRPFAADDACPYSFLCVEREERRDVGLGAGGGAREVRDRRRGAAEGVVERATDEATLIGHVLHAAGRVVGDRTGLDRIMPVLIRPYPAFEAESRIRTPTECRTKKTLHSLLHDHRLSRGLLGLLERSYVAAL